jgi:hypothetical protein
MALLIILPATAREGFDDAPGDTGELLSVGVTKEFADGQADDNDATRIPTITNLSRTSAGLEATRLGSTTYVSNRAASPDQDEVTKRAEARTAIENDADLSSDDRADALAAQPALSVGQYENPANMVHVNVADTGTVVNVTSDSGDPIDVFVAAGTTSGRFKIIQPTGTAVNTTGTATDPLREIEALDGDIITITAGSSVIRLTVDGQGPTFSDLAPRNRTRQDTDSSTVSFTVTDEGSGLRSDREDGPDSSADDDGESAEPLSYAEAATQPRGAAVDIDLAWRVGGRGSSGHDLDEERRGDRSWVEEERDHSYSLSFGRGSLASNTHYWYVWAKDRVGNVARTDSSSRPGNQDYTLIVDTLAPRAANILAGIGFDEEKGEEVEDSSSILVVFFDGPTGAGVEALDNDTIETAGFAVAGNTVVSIIHPDEEEDVDDNDTDRDTELTVADSDGDGDIDGDDDSTTLGELVDTATEVGVAGLPALNRALNLTDDDQITEPKVLKVADIFDDDTCGSHTGFNTEGRAFPEDVEEPNLSNCIDTTNRVYLQLGTPLANGEEPEVSIRSSSVRDLAGNGNGPVNDKEADNRIAPKLALEVVGDVEGAGGRPLAREEITVSMESGERLVQPPQVWFVEFDHTGEITVVSDANAALTGTNAWEATIDGDKSTKIGAIVVQASDRHRNTFVTRGLKGGADTPERGGDLDITRLAKEGLLVEFDFNIDEATITINPSEESTPFETDSKHPFIELNFSEGTENTKTYTDKDGEDATSNEFEDSKAMVDTKFDSYSMVTLTAVTVDGEDVLGRVARVDSDSFDLALGNLSVGDHTLEYTAMDVAGNEVTADQDFEVTPTKPYKIALRPGWNLVSFPGDPVDTAIDSVLPADHPATEVLKYEAGLWVAAVREAGQPWEGELTDIDGQSAYWINTGSTAPLSAQLVQPGVGSASRPPAISLIAGWNLIPVTDLDQEKQDAKTPSGEGDERKLGDDDHDNYFSSLDMDDFVVAYTYNAVTRSWNRLVQSDVVSNGQGVWVYVRSNVVLVP